MACIDKEGRKDGINHQRQQQQQQHIHHIAYLHVATTTLAVHSVVIKLRVLNTSRGHYFLACGPWITITACCDPAFCESGPLPEC